MKVMETHIAGVKLIQPTVFGDARGFFVETYQQQRYAELAGIDQTFVQDNHSRSRRGVLRGIHLQRIKPQGKLVRVSRGAVFDVVVDLRPESPSFGQWYGAELSDDNGYQLWVPPRLGHGFVVVSDIADFEYKCTEYYAPEDEATLAWDDPTVGIQWPEHQPQVSAKDAEGVPLAAFRA